VNLVVCKHSVEQESKMKQGDQDADEHVFFGKRNYLLVLNVSESILHLRALEFASHLILIEGGSKKRF
jgi:hypothetical protein